MVFVKIYYLNVFFTHSLYFPQTDNDRSQIFTYADDITILHENNTINNLINNINNTLRDIISWQESWLLKSNLQKKNKHAQDSHQYAIITTTSHTLKAAKYLASLMTIN